jgi:hypothetical protein
MKTKKVAAFVVGLFVSVGLFGAGDSFMRVSVTDSSEASEGRFTDEIPSWASDSINRLSDAGVIQGYSDGRFGSSDNLTRGQVVTLLYRTLKYKNIINEPDPEACSYYSDVKSPDYYYVPVCLVTLNSESAVFDDDPEVFGPDALVTRAEVARLTDLILGNTFLESLNKARETEVVFQDVPKDNKYFENIALVYTTGLMSGTSEGHFSPDGLLNRAEMSVIMDRTLNELESLNIKELAMSMRKEEYMTKCADLITSQTNKCAGYENWAISIQVSKQDMKANKSVVEVNEFRLGPGNKCSSKEAGGKYPADIQSGFLDNMESGGGEDVQVLCSVSCTGWSACSTDEEMANKCTGNSMKNSDCLATCDGTCEASPDQANCSVCVPTEEEGEDGATDDSTVDEGEDECEDEDDSYWYDDTTDQSNIVCTGEAIETSDCLAYCDGTCAASSQSGCSVCVAYGTDASDYGDISSCGSAPFYDCSQCNGLPSYPTFAYENCLTACQNAYYDASAAYNACLEQ